jgi:hypothetical protein
VPEEEEEDIMKMQSILAVNYLKLLNLIGNFFLTSQFIAYSFGQARKIVMIA